MIYFKAFYIDPVKVGDDKGINQLVVNNKERFAQFFPKTVERNLTPQLSKKFVTKKVNQYHNQEEFLFTLKNNDTHIIAGLIYIKEIDIIKKQGEFAYCIDAKHQGKGWVTQSVTALSQYAFKHLKLQTLQIIVHSSNLPSIKVAERCHFVWKHTLINEYTPPNCTPLDMELYELEKSAHA